MSARGTWWETEHRCQECGHIEEGRLDLAAEWWRVCAKCSARSVLTLIEYKSLARRWNPFTWRLSARTGEWVKL